MKEILKIENIKESRQDESEFEVSIKRRGIVHRWRMKRNESIQEKEEKAIWRELIACWRAVKEVLDRDEAGCAGGVFHGPMTFQDAQKEIIEELERSSQ